MEAEQFADAATGAAVVPGARGVDSGKLLPYPGPLSYSCQEPRERPRLFHAPFLFILGCGRSGTTLLQSMLDAHPQLAVSNEARFPASMARTRRRYETRDGFATGRFLEDLWDLPLSRSRFPEWQLSRTDLEAELTRQAPRTLPDAIRCVYMVYAQQQGKTRYGDKAPGYTRQMGPLAAAYPEASFIHIIRDGRDVASALIDASFVPSSVVWAALHWQHHVRTARVAGERLGPQRYYELSYEQLLDEPEGTLRSAAEFAGLQYDGRMLCYFEDEGRLAATTINRTQNHENLRRPPTKGLRDWRRDMTKEAVACFEHVAGATLADLGYELGADPSGRSPSIGRVTEQRLLFGLRQVGSRVKRASGDRLLRSGVSRLPGILAGTGL